MKAGANKEIAGITKLVTDSNSHCHSFLLCMTSAKGNGSWKHN
jgi:hypothetical protein